LVCGQLAIPAGISMELTAWFYFLLTFLLPVISVWVVIKYFAPSFNRKLSMISGSEAKLQFRFSKKVRRSFQLLPLISRTIGKWLTEKGTERMSFFTYLENNRAQQGF
jgi:ABC-2 type transport system permease protein